MKRKREVSIPMAILAVVAAVLVLGLFFVMLGDFDLGLPNVSWLNWLRR